jgi:hypothetical protein
MQKLTWRQNAAHYSFIVIAYAAWIGAYHLNKPAEARVPPPHDTQAKSWTPEKFGHIQCKSIKVVNDDSPFEIELIPHSTGAWIAISGKGQDDSCLCLSIAENDGPGNPYKIVASLMPDRLEAAQQQELTLEAGGGKPAAILIGDADGVETVTAEDYRPLPSYTAAELLQRLGEAAAYAVDAVLIYLGVDGRVPEAA